MSALYIHVHIPQTQSEMVIMATCRYRTQLLVTDITPLTRIKGKMGRFSGVILYKCKSNNGIFSSVAKLYKQHLACYSYIIYHSLNIARKKCIIQNDLSVAPSAWHYQNMMKINKFRDRRTYYHPVIISFS